MMGDSLKLTDWQVEYLTLLSGEGAYLRGYVDYGSWSLRAAPGRGAFHVLPRHGRSLVRRGLVKSMYTPTGQTPAYCIAEKGTAALNAHRAAASGDSAQGRG